MGFFAKTTAKGAKGELKGNLKQNLGISDGEKIITWIKEIAAKTPKKSYITFRELAELHKQDPIKYKLLYLTGSNMSTGRAAVFSHETTPDMVIASAVLIIFGVIGYISSVKSDRLESMESDTTVSE